jgi:hypothetical protein
MSERKHQPKRERPVLRKKVETTRNGDAGADYGGARHGEPRDYYDEERLDQFDRECVLKATVGRPRIRRIEFTKGSDEKARP